MREPSALQTGAPAPRGSVVSLLGLAAGRGQQPHLGRAVGRAEKGDLGAVRRPDGRRVRRPAREPAGRAVGADDPDRAQRAVLLGVELAEDVGALCPVRGEGGLLGNDERGQVVDAHGTAHGVASVS